MTRSAVLLKLNVANILLFNFCKQKFFKHGPITIAIDCNGFSLLIFEWPSYASGPKFAANSDSFWVRRLFNVCVRGFCACLHTHQDQNELHLKRWFFAKIGIFCESICRNISQRCSSIYTTIFVRRKDKTICQIRHELSVTIHEISTSWKKTLDGGPLQWRDSWIF